MDETQINLRDVQNAQGTNRRQTKIAKDRRSAPLPSFGPTILHTLIRPQDHQRKAIYRDIEYNDVMKS